LGAPVLGMTNRQRLTAVAALLALAGCAAASGIPPTNDADEESASKEDALAALKGRTVRVTYGVMEDPYLYQNASGYAGVLQDFLMQLQHVIGFVIEVTPVSLDSQAALASRPNNNTACARDIFFNRTDLCVGNSWITTERLSYAKVLPTLWQENLKVAVAATVEVRFVDELMTAFEPFEPLLWFIIFVIIILIAVFTWYVEVEDNDRDFPDKNPLQSFTTSLYQGLYGFFWSEPPTRPVTAEGRILLVGFGFFTLIMLSSYTASLASVMVARGNSASIKNLEMAIVRRKHVCMWESVLDRAKRLYPMLVELSTEMEDYMEGYQMLADGDCDVILIDEVFHHKAQELNPRECNKVLTGPPVLDINVAWTAADWLISPMSYFVTEEMGEGELDNLRATFAPKPQCPELTVSGNAELIGLQVSDVSGVFFIMSFFFVLALLITCFKRSAREGIRRSSTLQQFSERLSRSSRASARKESGSITAKSHDTDDADPEEPTLSMVKAFRRESRLRELPFEKALLVMGEAHARQHAELLRAIRNLKAGHRLSDTEVPADDLPTAAPLNRTKVPETSPGARV